MTPTIFREQLAQVTSRIAGQALDSQLDVWMNALVLYLLPQGRIEFTR